MKKNILELTSGWIWMAMSIAAVPVSLTVVLAADPPDEPTPSPVQSTARPFGLEIVGEVQSAATDDRSKDYRRTTISTVVRLLNDNLQERENMGDSRVYLDPSKLKLRTAADVRVYFVGEKTGYANTLGFTTDGTGTVNSETAKLIFPNASSSQTHYTDDSAVNRTQDEPLASGDFVDLGNMRAWTQLDFFLIADGARGGGNVFSTQTSANADGISHVVNVAYVSKDSSYLILGFEDMLGGGDRDYNDVLFALDIGAINITALTASPEPATIVTMTAFLGLCYVLVRRAPSSQSTSVKSGA